MQPGVYRQYIQIQDRHWWFISCRELVVFLLNFYLHGKQGRGLDVGCGTGASLDMLKPFCTEIVGMDASRLALDLASEYRPESLLIQADAMRIATLFRPQSFRLVTFFNVLYHEWVRDEGEVLRQALTVLEPGGIMVLMEPAFRILMRRHDRQDMGKTRYRLGFFVDQLRYLDFEILVGTYFNWICFFPALLQAGCDRLVKRPYQEQDPINELKIPPVFFNQILMAWMKLERRAIRIFSRLPWGVSVLMIARKRA